jgi:hypothetical protein
MLETLVFALLSVTASPNAAERLAAILQSPKWSSAPNYRSAERSVDNWRLESAVNLDLSPAPALSLAFGADLPQTPRCVRLNNYWCIKSAGWNGEIAADADGHVAFASASEGAAVAALLLRRYYIEFGRHSARAIVARWAPAQCATVLTSTRTLPGDTAPSAAAASRVNLTRMLPQRVVQMGLAPRGIQNTLRARWLSTHGRGGVAKVAGAKPRRARLSAVSAARIRVNDLMRAPSIAVGMGETDSAASALKVAEAQAGAPGRPVEAAARGKPDFAPSIPAFSCAGESARIANYAARVAEGVAKSADDDLALFTADGSPTDNLAKVMANMAAVEIGPLRASDALIALAIAQLRISSKPDSATR